MKFLRELALILKGPCGEKKMLWEFLLVGVMKFVLGSLGSKKDEIFIDGVINVFCTMYIWKDASLFCSYKVLI
jgi:hypothetical protein